LFRCMLLAMIFASICR